MAQWNPNLPTLQQSLPGLQGARSGQDLMRAYLQNQAQRQRNVAQPGMDKAKMAQMLAQTQGQNMQNEQMPERLGLDEYKAYIMAQNASHGMKNIELQYQKLGALRANAMSRLGRSQPGEIAQGMDPEAAAGALAGAKGFSQEFGKSYEQPGSIGGLAPQSPQQEQAVAVPNFPALQQFLGQGQQGGAPQPPQGVPPQGQPAQNQMQQPAAPDGMVKALMDAQMSASTKQTSDEKTRNQKRFSLVLNNLVSKRANLSNLFDKYVGAINKPKYLSDLKAGSKDALDFRSFMKTDIPMIANELKRTMGGQASDQETNLMESIVNPDWWFGDGKQARSQWNSFLENHKLIEKGLDVPLHDLFKRNQAVSTGTPRAQQPISAAPQGTVEMVTQNGESYAVPHSDIEAAIKHGWRRANG